MIEPYWGEFLINPVPLELSLNYCSHKCAYCFANLNRPDRQYNPVDTIRFLMSYQERETLPAHLLKAGYPVLLSNKVDPFAASNYRHTLPLLEILTGLGIPVQFQTRGGPGVDDALGIVGPSVWYITFTTLDDGLRARIEPGSPPIGDRLKLVERLTATGHKVVIGHNPCVPEWQPDPRPLLRQVKEAGAGGVWIERLHLNPGQIANMSPGERAALGAGLIDRAKKRKTSREDFDHIMRARDIAREEGLAAFSVGQANPSDFFAHYREIYPATFPVFQDFINALALADYGPADLITCNQFEAFLLPRLPKGRFTMAHYLGATSRDVFKRRDIHSTMDYRDLLRIIWEDPRTKYSLVKSPAFAFAGRRNERGWVQLVEEGSGSPLLVYNQGGFDGYYTEFEL